VIDFAKPAPVANGKGPTRDKPLRGADRLAAVAVMGSDKIAALADRPIDYAWTDIAILGIIALIAGGPSCGKTTLLFLILVARANLGEPVAILGRGVLPAPTGRFIVLIEGSMVRPPPRASSSSRAACSA
jgi:hypothetical protein